MKEHNQFRLRLNLFDGIVLVLALAAAVFLMWRFTRPAASGGRGEQRLGAVHRLLPALARRVRPGHPPGGPAGRQHQNYDVGTVVSAQAVPCQSLILDQVNRGICPGRRGRL